MPLKIFERNKKKCCTKWCREKSFKALMKSAPKNRSFKALLKMPLKIFFLRHFENCLTLFFEAIFVECLQIFYWHFKNANKNNLWHNIIVP
jgi:hypothetical protein